MGSGLDGALYDADRNGNPNVFNVERNANGLWLNNNIANPDNRWNPDDEFVFRLRQSFFPRYISVRFFFSGLLRLFFQPPSILPISPSFTAISSQCLLEINLPSQATDTRNLRPSVIKIHAAIFSAFFSFSVKYVLYDNSSKSKHLFSIRSPRV